MGFTVLLYTSLTLFALGLIYRISTWFSYQVGISAPDVTPSKRISAAAKGILGVIFSTKILTLIRVFVIDVALQHRILKEDVLRWVMHMLIYAGFMLLLLMHALGSIITVRLFDEYYSTLNPFFFLRDLFGVMVILGLLLAGYRRLILKIPRLKTNAMDNYAIIILALIMISGIVLEGAKITSYSKYQSMIAEYADTDDEVELRALESLWVRDFGVVSPHVTGPFDSEVIAQGQEIHEMNCAACHSSPKWAFMGYATAKALSPIAISLDKAGGATFLWYIHILACFIGLAYLPFSKMFHIIVSPLSLLANAVMDMNTSDPANIATRQVMELDACMHCCTCSLRCSASTALDVYKNELILPSEKMVFLKTFAAGEALGETELKAILEGIYLCTNCDRCTVVCPAGINLRDLWLNVREALIQRGYPEPLVLSPFSFFRGLNRERLVAYDYPKPLEGAKQAVAGEFDSLMDPGRPLSFGQSNSGQLSQPPTDSTFAHCFGCQNCTTVCPVVGSYDSPEEILGLLPHQIMCCLGLGLVEMAAGPRMLWDCVTCYQCQEHCPQNVKVTDLLYDLKNIAVRALKRKSGRGDTASMAT
jgi:heterodisulfide reductase subunit C/nitrate reductase gamma subunit